MIPDTPNAYNHYRYKCVHVIKDAAGSGEPAALFVRGIKYSFVTRYRHTPLLESDRSMISLGIIFRYLRPKLVFPE